ncbi:MAG: hypothetical protein IKN26_08725, partial [Eubacterium sp.]|nr:hypothetical protein [Eubacterium sp.]
MPRFDNEGFNPEKRIDNDLRDRSVPLDENYYLGGDELAPPVRSGRQSTESFSADILRDFDRERRDRNERDAEIRRASRPKKNPKKKKKRSGAKLFFAGLLAIVLIIIIAGVSMVNGVLGKINYDDKIENQYVASSDLKSERGVKNILLLGVDARKNQDTKTSHPDSM